jgi:hypothetical protein
MRRPLIRDQATSVVVGLALFGAGSWLLYEAWEGRGAKTPFLARLIKWW